MVDYAKIWNVLKKPIVPGQKLKNEEEEVSMWHLGKKHLSHYPYKTRPCYADVFVCVRSCRIRPTQQRWKDNHNS